jgi:hypothetical protein
MEAYTAYEWWLFSWVDDTVVCRVLSDEEGTPDLSEIQARCPAEVYQLAVEHPLCDAATYGGDLSTCPGVYLQFIKSYEAEREVVIELLPATAEITLEGCNREAGYLLCADLPGFQITGIEPLEGYHLTQVHFESQRTSGVCDGAVCSIPPWPTPSWGERITFWVDSSYGDSSEKYEALVRVKPYGDGRWRVDVLSQQFTDDSRQAMSLEWEAFPPLGENPEWLAYPADAADLASSEPYQYLAGQLIRAGAANASACADGGLLYGGYASQCGLEQAMDEVIAWQNRFDATILAVAERQSLSPQLLKNLIAQESQFWPGAYAISPHEYGLARLTVTGADTLLMWNEAFYESFCAPFLSEEACADGYHQLLPVHQDMLRGALATRVNLICKPCQFGFDASRAEYGIEILAQSLLANAAQVEQIFENLTKKMAGASASYEDLWRFTLVNYNAGAGCLSAALSATKKGNATLDWVNVSTHLVGDCATGIEYVENIAK